VERAAAESPLVKPPLPAELMVAPAQPPELAEIRNRRGGFWVTSYSGVQRARAGMDPAPETAEHPADGESIERGEVKPERLAGGAATGIFLHDLLERVPLDGLRGTPTFTSWFARPEIARLFEELRLRHDRPLGDIPLAARMVHAAYATPVRLGEGVMPGLASASAAVREMEFLYPIPERGQPLFSRPVKGAAPAWKIERGVVKGFIDLLFEHAGRVYVCDWKSDILPDHEPATLARHCEQHYDVQARIYALATLRLCGIAGRDDYERRFGGVVYCFLRGREGGGESGGIHAFRPSWAEVLAWEADMLGQRFWGMAR